WRETTKLPHCKKKSQARQKNCQSETKHSESCCNSVPCNRIQQLSFHSGEDMSDHYHDPADLRLLKEMGKLAPTEFNASLPLDQIVGRENGAIPRKYRELIALAVACTTQCP